MPNMRHSSSVHAIIPPNDRFTQMKSVLDTCQAAGVSVPPEVSSFFEGSHREFGQVIRLDGRETDIVTHGEEEYEIDLNKLPAGTEIIRFVCRCGTEQRFTVDRPSWSAMPLGTRAHSSIGGYWERVPNGWRAQSGCVFPTPGGDATHVSYPDNPELHISLAAQPEPQPSEYTDGEIRELTRAAQPEPPPRGDGAEVLPLVIADLQARSEMGRAKYGTTLRVNNGRNSLMDAYQEALDQVMYLRQRLEEERSTPKTLGEKLVDASAQFGGTVHALRSEIDKVTAERDAAQKRVKELLAGPVFDGISLAEARIARLRKGNVSCSHTETIRGADIPLRHGSCRSEVCLNCGAFRELDHHGNLRRDGAWQPASEYADAIAEQEA